MQRYRFLSERKKFKEKYKKIYKMLKSKKKIELT